MEIEINGKWCRVHQGGVMLNYDARCLAMEILEEVHPELPVPTPPEMVDLLESGVFLLRAGFDADQIRQFFSEN